MRFGFVAQYWTLRPRRTCNTILRPTCLEFICFFILLGFFLSFQILCFIFLLPFRAAGASILMRKPLTKMTSTYALIFSIKLLDATRKGKIKKNKKMKHTKKTESCIRNKSWMRSAVKPRDVNDPRFGGCHGSCNL